MLELSIDYAIVLLRMNRIVSTLLAPTQRIGLDRNRAVSNQHDADRDLWNALDRTSSPLTHELSRTLPYHINIGCSTLLSQSSIGNQASSNQPSEEKARVIQTIQIQKTSVFKVIEV